jgi:hypothetical protein
MQFNSMRQKEKIVDSLKMFDCKPTIVKRAAAAAFYLIDSSSFTAPHYGVVVVKREKMRRSRSYASPIHSHTTHSAIARKNKLETIKAIPRLSKLSPDNVSNLLIRMSFKIQELRINNYKSRRREREKIN